MTKNIPKQLVENNVHSVQGSVLILEGIQSLIVVEGFLSQLAIVKRVLFTNFSIFISYHLYISFYGLVCLVLPEFVIVNH